MLALTYRPVTASDAPFLYELLADRPPEAAISRWAMPTYEQHVAFVQQHPYAVWEIIELHGKPVGSIYLTDGDTAGQTLSEIGIFLKTEARGNGIGRQAVQEFMDRYPRKRFLANIAPMNRASQYFFEGLGFKLVQYTYALYADR